MAGVVPPVRHESVQLLQSPVTIHQIHVCMSRIQSDLETGAEFHLEEMVFTKPIYIMANMI